MNVTKEPSTTELRTNWSRPTWATTVCKDDTSISFERPSATKIEFLIDGGETEYGEVSLLRADKVVVDTDVCTVTVRTGNVTIWLGEDVNEITIDGARQLRDALTELLAAVEATE